MKFSHVMIKCLIYKIFNLNVLAMAVLAGVLLLIACQPQLPVKQASPITQPFKKVKEHGYYESTLFFDKHNTSLSMRAALKKTDDSLAKGYQFQFRSRRDRPVKIGNIAITVAGKRIILGSDSFYLPRNKSLVFSLSVIDSQFIQSQSQAVFLFEYESDTKIALIKKHALVEFITHQEPLE